MVVIMDEKLETPETLDTQDEDKQTQKHNKT